MAECAALRAALAAYLAAVVDVVRRRGHFVVGLRIAAPYERLTGSISLDPTDQSDLTGPAHGEVVVSWDEGFGWCALRRPDPDQPPATRRYLTPDPSQVSEFLDADLTGRAEHDTAHPAGYRYRGSDDPHQLLTRLTAHRAGC